MATHGLPSTYRHGCRCDECRTAHTADCAARRAQRSERPADEVPHGLSGYNNWACRCGTCSLAKSEANAQYWASVGGVR
jgi:hypothetical protein